MKNITSLYIPISVVDTMYYATREGQAYTPCEGGHSPISGISGELCLTLDNYSRRLIPNIYCHAHAMAVSPELGDQIASEFEGIQLGEVSFTKWKGKTLEIEVPDKRFRKVRMLSVLPTVVLQVDQEHTDPGCISCCSVCGRISTRLTIDRLHQDGFGIVTQPLKTPKPLGPVQIESNSTIYVTDDFVLMCERMNLKELKFEHIGQIGWVD